MSVITMSVIRECAALDSALQAWFCIRSQVKREHIAGVHLSRLRGIEVFSPRLRRRQHTRRGMVWTTESVFPSYLFARFDFQTELDRVMHTPGVSGVVHFGLTYPIVPENLIKELQAEFPEGNLPVQQDEILPGTVVTFLDLPWRGLQGVVLRTLPAKDRVQVLMNMLGNACKLEVDRPSLLVETGTKVHLPLVVSRSELRAQCLSRQTA